MKILFRLFFAAMCAAALCAACGSPQDPVTPTRSRPSLEVEFPSGWRHGGESQAGGGPIKVWGEDRSRHIALEIALADNAGGLTPEATIARLQRTRAIGADDAERRVMFDGKYAMLRWCSGPWCMLSAVRTPSSDPALMITMEVRWPAGEDPPLDEAEGILRRADAK